VSEAVTVVSGTEKTRTVALGGYAAFAAVVLAHLVRT
jgi:hypothetical protein